MAGIFISAKEAVCSLNSNLNSANASAFGCQVKPLCYVVCTNFMLEVALLRLRENGLAVLPDTLGA